MAVSHLLFTPSQYIPILLYCIQLQSGSLATQTHALTLIPLSIQIQPLSPLLRLMRRPTSNPFLSSFLPFIALIHLLSPLPFAHLSPASPNFPAFFHRHLPHLPQQCLYQFIFSVRQLSLNSLPYMTYLAF